MKFKAFLRTRCGLLFWTVTMIFAGYGVATFGQTEIGVVSIDKDVVCTAADRQLQRDDRDAFQWNWI